MRITRISLTVLILIILIEIALRLIWGFGNPVLYSQSNFFEYCYAPNQDVQRYGNHILTNSFGMRSDEPSPSDSIRILYLGDSVINGGMQTSQDELSSSLLSESLSSHLNKKVNMLNISAGSWGPDNAAGYLKKYGMFDAKAMVLVFSSHDAYDNMDFEPVVGLNINYPSHKPTFAIAEVVTRYLLPYINNIVGNQNFTSDKLMINKQHKTFNSGWKDLIQMADSLNIPVLVVLHAEQNELEEKRYNRYGKTILDSLAKSNTYFLTDLQMGIPKTDYRDFIHLNKKGQQFLADNLKEPILQLLQSKAARRYN